MTEQEWLGCAKPEAMLEFLKDKASDRKLRLFVIAHVRRGWRDYESKETQQAWKAIEVAEQFADGLVSDKQLEAAHDAFLLTPEWDDLSIHFLNTYAGAATATEVGNAFAFATASDYAARTAPHAPPIIDADRVERCRLLRDVMGNPFRPITFDPCCLTPSVVNLTQEIYDTRAFDRLPVLSEALEEAGCKNAEVLAHCRGPGPHVKGCWVIDTILGKE